MDLYDMWRREHHRLSIRFGVLVERQHRILVSRLWARRRQDKIRYERLAISNEILERAILKLENPYR